MERRWFSGAIVLGLAWKVLGCASSVPGGAVAADAGALDAGLLDAGAFDASTPDARAFDAGPVEAAALEWASAFCDKAIACTPMSAWLFGSRASCVNGVLRVVRGYAATEGATLGEATFRACTAGVAASACTDLSVRDPLSSCGAVREALRGALAEGATCEFHFQCATGFCAGAGGYCGVCAKAPAKGEPCVENQCPPGLACGNGPEPVCERLPSLGERCDMACAGSAACLSGRCRQVASEGRDCVTPEDGEGARPFQCDIGTGFACNPLSGRCERFRFATAPGAACYLDRSTGAITLCAGDTYCEIVDEYRGKGVCRARLPEGAACTASSDFMFGERCAYPATCENGFCRTKLGRTCQTREAAECTATVCGDRCFETLFDGNHCGSCSGACPSSTPSCNGGTCGCPAGMQRCAGACVPNDEANCGACGVACSGATPYCVGQRCVAAAPPPSCAGGLTCASGLSCCDARAVPGGTFPMGASASGAEAAACDGASGGWAEWCSSAETPEHPVTVSPYVLDTFEVTVGRFRNFVAAYPASKPADGAGAHPRVPNSGWSANWNALLPVDRAALIASLRCDAEPRLSTWTNAPGPHETRPINCVSWPLAFAFCAWDGGRLPTEAEWEFAAAGGAENRVLPWGDAYPTAAHGAFTPLAPAPPLDAGPAPGPPSPPVSAPATLLDLPPVGSYPFSPARWGHRDLAGSVVEWVLDSSASFSEDPAVDPADLSSEDVRVMKGGAFQDRPGRVRAAARDSNRADSRAIGLGFRCARQP